MKILLSNDDGIDAPGLQALANALRQLASIQIIAPDRNRSGASNSLSLARPLRIKYLDDERISVQGTPTDCVFLGLRGLLPEVPDMVVSGINRGANLGDDIWYSGTVAAAMEGRVLGFPAIAVSLVGPEPQHFATAGEVIKRIVERLMIEPLPPKIILNINIPDVPYAELQGWAVTRLGSRCNDEPIIKQLDPRGETIYWIGLPGCAQDGGPGTDFFAIAEKKVSVTPIHIDASDYSAMQPVTQWLSDLGI